MDLPNLNHNRLRPVPSMIVVRGSNTTTEEQTTFTFRDLHNAMADNNLRPEGKRVRLDRAGQDISASPAQDKVEPYNVDDEQVPEDAAFFTHQFQEQLSGASLFQIVVTQSGILTIIRRDLVLVKARNEFVKAGLKKAYAKKVNDKTLEVFCVSNKDYFKDCREGRTQFVEAGGIPELRKFCHSINAEAQLDESKNYLLAELPTLFASTQVWMETILEEVEDEDDIDAARKKLLRDILKVQQKVLIPTALCKYAPLMQCRCGPVLGNG